MTVSGMFAGESNERTATCGREEETAFRMETVSIRQVATRNSVRRRRAPVSNCACMRLESATRTLIGPDAGPDDGLIDEGSQDCGDCRERYGVLQGNY